MSLFSEREKKEYGASDFGLGDAETRREHEQEKEGVDQEASDSSEDKGKLSFLTDLFKRKPKNGEDIKVGANVDNVPNSPFGESLSVKTDADIPDEKERRKRRRGKSQISLGEKYSGKRKIFAFMVLGIIGLVFAVLYLLINQSNMVSQGELDDQVEDAISEQTASQFPVGEAAIQMEAFIRTYGTWSDATPAARASELSRFLAPDVDEQAGWDGNGEQQVIYSAVSQTPEIVDSNRAIFDASYQIDDGTWRCVRVPLYAYQPESESEGPVDNWAFSVTSNPTPVPCSNPVSVPEFEENEFPNTDTDAADSLQDQFFPGFFSAWVTSDEDTLLQYMAPNVRTFGLGGIYEADPEITEVILPIGAEENSAQPDTEYTAFVTVEFTDNNGGTVTPTYQVPISYTGTQWQVTGEPEALAQGLEVTGGGSPNVEGTDPDADEEDQSDYAEPDQPGADEPGDSDPTVPDEGTSDDSTDTPEDNEDTEADNDE